MGWFTSPRKGPGVFVLGVLAALLGLLVSIALHEVGHLVAAKRFGIKVTQYMVGFGPTLWSRRRGETEYGIKAIPVGGYVRLIGMYPPARVPANAGAGGFLRSLADDARAASAQEVGPGEESRAVYSQTVPKRLLVMGAGPAVNLLIAVVLIGVVLVGIGTPALTSTVGTVSECVVPVQEAPRECTAADQVAPGSAAGLQQGDVLLSWGGQAVSDWEEVSAAIVASGQRAADVVVERDGERLELVVRPVLAERPVIVDGALVVDDDGEPVLQERPFVGIGPGFALVPQGLGAVPGAVVDMLAGTLDIVIGLPQRLVAVGEAAFGGGERDPQGVVGPVGLGRFAGEIAALDSEDYTTSARLADMLWLLAALNVALFVFNLIPLVPLDGGHMAGALWEGARRRVARVLGRPDPGPVDIARAMPLAFVVVLLVIGMGLLLAYADIVRPVTLGG